MAVSSEVSWTVRVIQYTGGYTVQRRREAGREAVVALREDPEFKQWVRRDDPPAASKGARSGGRSPLPLADLHQRGKQQQQQGAGKVGEGAQSPPPRQQPIIDPRTDWGVGQGVQQQRGQQRRDQGAASDRATPRASSAEEQPGGQLQAAQHTEALPAGGFRGSLSDTSHVHLFVAVVSLAANRLKRDAARSTWGTDPRCSPPHSSCYADFISSHMYMMCLQFKFGNIIVCMIGALCTGCGLHIAGIVSSCTKRCSA